MLKKLLKLTTVFAILLAAYSGYSRAFDLVAIRLTAARKVKEVPFVRQASKSEKEATRLALEAFGPGHWTTADDLNLRFYYATRGFWMYSQNYKRVAEENGVKYDGKRIDLTPMAIILKAADGKSTKTVLADHARLDLNQPLGLNTKSDSEAMVVKFARLEGNVMIRDDRGTPGDLGDDLLIGPLTHVEYDDDKLQVTSQSDVLIVDRDTRVTGEGGADGGLKILLRPKLPAPNATTRSTGFEGAQTAWLFKNPHVVFNDVSKAGVLPTASEVKKGESGKVEATVEVDASGKTSKAATEPTPLDIRSDGPMQVDLPRPVTPVKVGPPSPQGPTLVNFSRNVAVSRGRLKEEPDRMLSDSLDLILVQAEKPATAAEASPSKPAGEMPAVSTPPEGGGGTESGVFGDLTLRRVKATGHAVWLYLPGQGAKIRCNELIHKVAAPDQEGLTYFRGDTPTKNESGTAGTPKLTVEKIDYTVEPAPGADGRVKRTPQSITWIYAIDATLHDNGAGGMETSNLFARGPGYLVTRPYPAPGHTPAADTPPDRTVRWQDSLEIKNLLGPDKLVARREIIVKGRPYIEDRLRRSSLAATDTIVASLIPRPAVPNAAGAAGQGKGDSGSSSPTFRIQHLLALGNARLIAPSRYLTARKRLDVEFDELARPTIRNDRGPAPPPSGGSAPPSSAAPRDTIVADAGNPAAKDGPKADASKPADPPMTAIADTVEARVLLDPDAPAGAPKTPATATTTASTSGLGVPGGSGSGQEIRDVRMFGGVRLHQDPAAGKVKASDARGECLVLRNEGPGRAIFNLYHEDPRIPKEARDPAVVRPRAQVITEDMTVEGNVIGVNQVTDQAWVYGAGKLIQYTDRGMLTDRSDPGNASDAAKQAQAPPKIRMRAGKVLPDKVPLSITWGEKMLFQGRTVDTENRPAAKAMFFKDVRALMEDGELRCDEVMTTYTDQPIPLAELGKLKQSAGQNPTTGQGQGQEGDEVQKPKPDLAFIDMQGKAVAVSRKVDENRPILLSRQKISGDRILYDRRTGDFQVPGKGVVLLHERENKSAFQSAPAAGGVIAGGHTVRPTGDKPGARPAPGTRATGAKPALGANPAQDDGTAISPLVLTKIEFSREMKGRFGTGKSADQVATRHAEFFGDIQAARAKVRNESIPLDFDRLPGDAYFLTSQTMRVVTEPPPPGSPANAPARNFLKAWENAYARTVDSTVQADVITYDSQNDLIYATGEEGRQVVIVKQDGTGQSFSPAGAQALRVNPKTGDVSLIGPRDMQLVDGKTGTRPRPVAPPDPNAKPAKPKKPPYKLQQSSPERRGFTGR